MDPIVIGVAGPMTGLLASLGAELKVAVELAVADINAAGGLLGREVILRIADDAGDPLMAVAVANQFVAEGLDVVVGHVTAETTSPANQVYSENGILYFAPAITALGYSGGREGVYRVSPREDDQPAPLLEQALNDNPTARAAIVYEDTPDAFDMFVNADLALASFGKSPVLRQYFEPNALGVEAIVGDASTGTGILGERADIVFIAAGTEAAGLLARRLHDAGSTATLLITDQVDPEDYLTIAGEAAANRTLISRLAVSSDEPSAEALRERLSALGHDGNGIELYAFAAVEVWAQAVAASTSLDFSSIAPVLLDRNFDTVLGRFGFDTSKDMEGAWYDISTWVGSELQVLEPGSEPLGGTSGNDLLEGTPGPDTIDALAGHDRLFGRAGDDTLSAGAGSDVVYAEDGNDTIFGGPGIDLLSGDHRIPLEFGFLVPKSLGITSIRQLEGATFAVQAGSIEELAVAAFMSASGLSYDLVSVASNSEALALFESGRADAYAYIYPYDVLTKLSSPSSFIVLPELFGPHPEYDDGRPDDAVFGDDHIEGGADDDLLYGDHGRDTLVGGSGNDILDGGPNAAGLGDFLLGGEGHDLYCVDDTFDLVDEGFVFPEAGFGGFDTIVSKANWFWDVYGVGERVVIGEGATDPTGAGTTVVAGIHGNEIIGNSATNIAFGRGGSDTYRLGDGIDWISLSLLGLTDENAYVGVNGSNTVIVDPRAAGAFSYDIVFDFESGRDSLDVARYGYGSAAEVMARGVNDGLGSSYFILGDGFDYLYMVGLELSELSAADFIV